MLFKILLSLYTTHLFEVLFMLCELIWSINLEICKPLPQDNHVFICSLLNIYMYFVVYIVYSWLIA